MALADVPEGTKEKLKAIRSAIDKCELTKQIEKLEKKLDKAYQTKVRGDNNGKTQEAFKALYL